MSLIDSNFTNQHNPQKKSIFHHIAELHSRSYMSAHVLLNLLNELGEKDKMQGLLISFSQQV